ncbi:SNF5-domain-containing protein [Trichodelitschia bisporula]|uniref:SNF5-domain-containing protein n=1 Tax=Trichodelitschia bisporula TaxID=703511 RepID=A0A6G1I2E3_9PEZI|nr:SNF5-domain-containing protein [Trichodelitschia bisporula]
MPTPVVTVADSAPPLRDDDTRTSPSRFSTSPPERDGSDTNHTPDAGSVGHPSDGSASVLDERDAIREGKEKAKAIVAAAGVRTTSDGGAHLNSHLHRVINGTSSSQSRKRSRSGSRKPRNSPMLGFDQQPVDNPLGKKLLNRYRERDQIHASHLNDQYQAIRSLFDEKHKEQHTYDLMAQVRRANPGEIFGVGYEGYGNGRTDGPFRLIYPQHRTRAGKRRTRPLHINKEDMLNQSDQLEELVPVRIDIEHDKIKLRDTFTWNLHDRVTPPELFAEGLVEDFQVPPEHVPYVTQQVQQKLQEQIQDYYPHVFIEEEPLDPHLPYSAYKNDEMRILIKLNITIGPHTLVDQFEWEINNPLNCPEEFARAMARDLSLSGEFTTAIAHQIREQSQMFTKSLYITGHPFDGRPIEDADVRDGFLPSPINSIFRPSQSAKDYAPWLYELNEADLQREEMSILREQRRQKRSVTRRGGPALPDLKDRERTVRSLVVSSVLPGAAPSLENARLFKLSRVSGRGRRAARTDGADDSDESDSSESESEEVVTTLAPQGTARTRGIRGAATAAQAAMRANLGRSATPEIAASLHHHETRTSARRSGLDIREDSVAETPSLIVKLKMPREKFRLWLRNRKTKPSGEYQQSRLGTPLMASQNSAAQPNSHSAATTAMPPPPSPAPQSRAASAGARNGTPLSESQTPTSVNGQQYQYYPDGRVDAPYPAPPPGQQPPPPSWLQTALTTLQSKYPHDSFEGWMKYGAVDRETNDIIGPNQLPQGAPPPPHVKHQWLPRIKCNDCPGKLYTAGPERTVDNFEVHLRNRQHKERVEARRKSGN